MSDDEQLAVPEGVMDTETDSSAPASSQDDVLIPEYPAKGTSTRDVAAATVAQGPGNGDGGERPALLASRVWAPKEARTLSPEETADAIIRSMGMDPPQPEPRTSDGLPEWRVEHSYAMPVEGAHPWHRAVGPWRPNPALAQANIPKPPTANASPDLAARARAWLLAEGFDRYVEADLDTKLGHLLEQTREEGRRMADPCPPTNPLPERIRAFDLDARTITWLYDSEAEVRAIVTGAAETHGNRMAEEPSVKALIAAAIRVAENYDPEPVGLSPIEQQLVEALAPWWGGARAISNHAFEEPTAAEKPKP